jgi:hypothetical protein
MGTQGYSGVLLGYYWGTTGVLLGYYRGSMGYYREMGVLDGYSTGT